MVGTWWTVLGLTSDIVGFSILAINWRVLFAGPEIHVKYGKFPALMKARGAVASVIPDHLNKLRLTEYIDVSEDGKSFLFDHAKMIREENAKFSMDSGVLGRIEKILEDSADLLVELRKQEYVEKEINRGFTKLGILLVLGGFFLQIIGAFSS